MRHPAPIGPRATRVLDCKSHRVAWGAVVRTWHPSGDAEREWCRDGQFLAARATMRGIECRCAGAVVTTGLAGGEIGEDRVDDPTSSLRERHFRDVSMHAVTRKVRVTARSQPVLFETALALRGRAPRIGCFGEVRPPPDDGDGVGRLLTCRTRDHLAARTASTSGHGESCCCRGPPHWDSIPTFSEIVDAGSRLRGNPHDARGATRAAASLAALSAFADRRSVQCGTSRESVRLGG